MNKRLLFPLLLASCGTIPLDTSPDWASNNRYAIEMKNDCNSVTHSVGLAGCLIKKSNVNGNLILPSLWTGTLTFTSSNCTSFTLSTNSTTDTILPLKQLYTATNGENCSYQINRSITEKGLESESSMIGRFFIEAVSDNQYYRPIKIGVKGKTYTGVATHQHKTGQYVEDVVIYPSSSTGTFIAKCDGEDVLTVNYTSSPFTVNFPVDVSCDYELGTQSKTSPLMDIGSYVREVSTNTVDLTAPLISIKSSKFNVSFLDKDSSGKNPVVIGTQIESTKCPKKSTCKVVNNKKKYLVKAITPSLRQFLGIYDVNAKTWEVFE